MYVCVCACDLLIFLNSGCSTDGDKERVRLVGPTEPITNLRIPANKHTSHTCAHKHTHTHLHMLSTCLKLHLLACLLCQLSRFLIDASDLQ